MPVYVAEVAAAVKAREERKLVLKTRKLKLGKEKVLRILAAHVRPAVARHFV